MFQCHPKLYFYSIPESKYKVTLKIKNFNIEDLKIINPRPGSLPGFHQKRVKRGEL